MKTLLASRGDQFLSSVSKDEYEIMNVADDSVVSIDFEHALNLLKEWACEETCPDACIMGHGFDMLIEAGEMQ
jgi:hypothetical protein